MPKRTAYQNTTKHGLNKSIHQRNKRPKNKTLLKNLTQKEAEKIVFSLSKKEAQTLLARIKKIRRSKSREMHFENLAQALAGRLYLLKAKELREKKK